MALEAIPLDNVGVEVRGFDIREPVSEALQRELVELWNEHGILLFRGQDVTPENQIAFSRIFGELETHPLKATTSDQYPELFMLVNDPEKEKFMIATYRGEQVAGRLDWHMDLHYTGKPNHGALLRAVVCAEQDGLTGFGDLALAYEALDEDTQALLQKLEVAYTFSMQRRHMRYVDLEGYEAGACSPRKPADMSFPNFPDVAYPAVVTHPVSGRKVLEICEQFLDRDGDLAFYLHRTQAGRGHQHIDHRHDDLRFFLARCVLQRDQSGHDRDDEYEQRQAAAERLTNHPVEEMRFRGFHGWETGKIATVPCNFPPFSWRLPGHRY